ncbi:MAG: tetratricopeptide repeat protein [Deltaproteobacteria bacterium]|nr:tetratricopeptide repeat protein [Deltaproteobacteria bacterium]
MRRWELTGLVATLLLVLALPFYLWQSWRRPVRRPEPAPTTFVGRQACARCHPREDRAYADSDHAHAMAKATAETVLGDFNDATFTIHGVTSRFFRRDGKFFVHTRGVGGKMADFEVTHTFGWTPLQQYLVPFPGGRLQCLPLAWDVKQKKWFHLYPEENFSPDDWRYWTNRAQTWNSMCADCHSTNFRKGYDFVKDVYHSRYGEINVSCEACHGPGSRHVAWATTMQPLDSDDGLVVHTGRMTAREQVELCAFCHSRRTSLGDYRHGRHLLDNMIPRLLDEGLYFADGQIQDEVYVYNSFLQSKMFARGVRCSDCHDIHSLKLRHKGNRICLQCHQGDVYDRYQHHFHRQAGDPRGKPLRAADGRIRFAVGTGALCVECHMPGRVYMGNDYRPDHSLRVPRPALNRELNTPDACLRCHVDKDHQWSVACTTRWYGEKRPAHYGTVLARGRRGEPGARDGLLRLVDNSLYPLVVRATALELLGQYQGSGVRARFKRCLDSDEALLRQTALMTVPPAERVKLAVPLLSDPVKAVRIAAARNLTLVAPAALDENQRRRHERALAEFQQVLAYSADFADSRMNLGTLYLYQGKEEMAAAAFRKAIAIDRDCYAAYRNLAVLYSRQHKFEPAEEILRRALARRDDLYDLHYSLGLLLAERKEYRPAVAELQKAARGLPNDARVHYNLGLLLQFGRRGPEAEKALARAVALEPGNGRYLEALARLYLAEGKLSRAAEVAARLTAVDPDNRFARQLREYLEKLKK